MTTALVPTLAGLVEQLDRAVRAPGAGLDVPHAVGEEHEIRYRLVGDGLVEDGHTIGPRGEVTVLTPPGDIHAVVNDGTEVAVSLHVYGADLRRRGTSVRRCYDLPIR